jgi:hypothetical protein
MVKNKDDGPRGIEKLESPENFMLGLKCLE